MSVRLPALAFVATLALGASLALPNAAMAKPGDSQCLWDHLADKGMAGYMAALESGVGKPQLVEFVAANDITMGVRACTASNNLAGIAFAFDAFNHRKLAEEQLLKRNGISLGELESAWKRVDSAKARRMAEALERGDTKTSSDLMVEVLPLFEAQFPQPPDRMLAITYILTRADLEYLETTF